MNILPKESNSNLFLRLHPLHRILLGLLFAGMTWLLLRPYHLHPLQLTLYLWDMFCLVMLIAAWIVIYTSPVTHIRHVARREDGSKLYVFLLILLATFSSLLALLLLFISPASAEMGHLSFVLTCIPTLFLSGAFIHTTFAFHYANLYYDDDAKDSSRHAAGLDFPKEDKPDYRDFAYFAFVIGMTFQVSDVQITSRRIRFLALVHGVLSFIINTFVVAIGINLVAGLKK